MQFTELKNEGLNFHVQVKIPTSAIEGKIQEELIQLSKKIKLPGFRTGKIPIDIVNKKYGASVKRDVIHEEIKSSISQIITKNNLNVASEPNLEDIKTEDGQDIEYVLKFELLPKIDMPDFKKITIEKPIIKIEDKEIDEQLNKLVEFSKNYNKESKGKAVKGDQVTIDAIGCVDKVEFEGGKLTDHKLVLGSKSFIDNFEDQLIGTKVGDTLTVKVTFPEQYHASHLAGKAADFEVTIKAVHKADKLEINDEFAKKFNSENIEKLREQIAKNIESSYEESIHTYMKMNLFNHLEDILSFEVPASLLEREYQILKGQSTQLNESDPILKSKSEEEVDKYYKKLSLRRVKIGLMLSEYVQLNGLRITSNDIKEAVMSQARNFPGQEKTIIDYYQKNSKAIESLRGPILEEKAVKHIFENQAKIKEKEYTRNEFEKLLEQEAQ